MNKIRLHAFLGKLATIKGEIAWVMVGQVSALAGGLVGVRLLTELLDPVVYGELALGVTVAVLVNQTVLGPLGNGALRFYAPAVERNELSGFLKAVGSLLLVATGIIVFMILLAGAPTAVFWA